MSNDIEAVINSLPKKKTDRFTTEFYKDFDELTPMLLKLFHEIKEEETLPNSN
jgi:hypothetical protein